jgi:hypothetical protein
VWIAIVRRRREIEEANDHEIRKARVNALFGATQMAAQMAATEGDKTQQTTNAGSAEVVSLSDVRDTSPLPATATG